jgi:hypothetical protein
MSVYEPRTLEGERKTLQRPQARRDRLAWREYHQGQAERLRRTVEPLIAFHETQAARLCGEGRT